MIEEFDRVRIVKTGVTGIVVDIYESSGSKRFTVESDEKGIPGGWWNGEDTWNLFTCTESELEKINGNR